MFRAEIDVTTLVKGGLKLCDVPSPIRSKSSTLRYECEGCHKVLGGHEGLTDKNDEYQEAMIYSTGERKPTDEDCSQEQADVVNGAIYWTIDRDLSIPLKGISIPYDRVEELRKQFAGVSFSVKQHILSQIMTANLRDRLQRAGTSLPDDIFALMLMYTMPAGFPDISSNFEVTILKDASYVVSTSDITQTIMAADVSALEILPTSKLHKVLTLVTFKEI
ncbi:hypothetical protein CROQUDRAFT_87299 [Cronartium quercuum f. sp. fusiforme G11]|uniref:Uncharacterized protein n=1 Tax=Cronartium quercuum f. sp. fusiforme G11 TaxID=708437 RepID=A0A9P6TFX1_9BASI|nr:hypothetical protein CROQUDRAFT_87299 [Cronartium quercuum f. sp. fusiforme G11]